MQNKRFVREIFLEIFLINPGNIPNQSVFKDIGLYNIESRFFMTAILENGTISHGSISKMNGSRLSYHNTTYCVDRYMFHSFIKNDVNCLF